MVGPHHCGAIDRETDREIVHILRVIVGIERDSVEIRAARDRVASERILKRFSVPTAHRLMIWD